MRKDDMFSMISAQSSTKYSSRIPAVLPIRSGIGRRSCQMFVAPGNAFSEVVSVASDDEMVTAELLLLVTVSVVVVTFVAAAVVVDVIDDAAVVVAV